MLKIEILELFSRSLSRCIRRGWCQCIHMSKEAVLQCPVENLSNSSFGSGYDWLIPLLHWRRCRLAYGPKSEIHLVHMTVDRGLFHTIRYGRTCGAILLNLLDCTKSGKILALNSSAEQNTMLEFSSFPSGSCHLRRTCQNCSSTCMLGENIYSPHSTQQIPVHLFARSLAESAKFSHLWDHRIFRNNFNNENNCSFAFAKLPEIL
jgi:hypothetical protein